MSKRKKKIKRTPEQMKKLREKQRKMMKVSMKKHKQNNNKHKEKKKLKMKPIKKTRKKRSVNKHKPNMSFLSNGHMKIMSKDELRNMEDYSSLKYRKKITNELNNIIGIVEKGVSDPFYYKGRTIGISFTNPLGEPWSKDDDYLPEDIRNGHLGLHTFQTVSQSRVLGNDETTQGSTGMNHQEGDEPVWNIGNMGSVWIDMRHNETPYRVHYISKHNQDKKRPIVLIVENMETI